MHNISPTTGVYYLDMVSSRIHCSHVIIYNAEPRFGLCSDPSIGKKRSRRSYKASMTSLLEHSFAHPAAYHFFQKKSTDHFFIKLAVIWVNWALFFSTHTLKTKIQSKNYLTTSNFKAKICTACTVLQRWGHATRHSMWLGTPFALDVTNLNAIGGDDPQYSELKLGYSAPA